MKKNRIILAVLVVLILLAILFCWPKKLERLLGNQEIASFMGSTTVTSFSYGSTHHDIRTVESPLSEEDQIARLEEIMFSCRYRPMLKTLFQPNHFELNGDSSAYLFLIMSDGSAVTVNYMGEDLVSLHSGGFFSLILRPMDKEVSSRLAEFFTEIGTKP